ncbi:hypothetical protein JZ751_007687, partial [Albula glossodonta]
MQVRTVGKVVLSVEQPEGAGAQVTYLLQGCLAHEDFCGHSGTLKPGDLQEPLHGLQLWVNLRRAEKMVEPRYQELKSREVPKPRRDGVTVAVISGEALGVKVNIGCLVVPASPGRSHGDWPVCRGWTTIIYTLSGAVHVGPDNDQRRVEPHHTVVFNDGDRVKAENKASKESHFVLIAGEPVNEPVVHHGPFVMNTEEEIDQAI